MPTHGVTCELISFAVNTATTPFMARAASTVIDEVNYLVTDLEYMFTGSHKAQLKTGAPFLC